ncbi:MAG TPA: nuclease-related domain-containing protein [Gammaproteobacteria bacterium]|nr:nuclease-related domain-containing protein [Gammaproteobacteria bacterium]
MSTQYWIGLGGAAVVVLAGALWYSVWRRRRPEVLQVLQTTALDAAHDVLLPNGMGGQIYIEHLLLTGHGVVVVDVKQFEGTIFGGDRMDEWTVIKENRRFTFPNPQATLYDRVAAVRRLAREVPVHGYVLFSSRADFTKGRPRDVILADEFEQRFKKPEKADLEEVTLALGPHWERIKEAAHPG